MFEKATAGVWEAMSALLSLSGSRSPNSLSKTVSSSADSLLCGGTLTCLLFLFPLQMALYSTLFEKAAATYSRLSGTYRPAFLIPEGLLQPGRPPSPAETLSHSEKNHTTYG